MSDKRKTNRRGPFYWIEKDGVEKNYLSVTKVLSVIDKSGPLMWWASEQVYDAMCKDPSLSKEEAMASFRQTGKSARDRGTQVHRAVENYKKGGNMVTNDEELKPYIEAFKSWISDNDVEVIENERTVVSEKYRYAGTLDMLAMVNGKKLLIDLKTGKNLYNEVHLQTSAYREALSENGVEVDGVNALLLKEDGTYVFQENKEQFKAFLSAKYLYEGLHSKYLIKMGYLPNKQEGLFK